MLIHKLLDGVSSAGAGTEANINKHQNRIEGVAQVDISDTATVEIQGRMAPGGTWITLATFTETDAARVVMMPFMRAEVTSYSAGTISAWVG